MKHRNEFLAGRRNFPLDGSRPGGATRRGAGRVGAAGTIPGGGRTGLPGGTASPGKGGGGLGSTASCGCGNTGSGGSAFVPGPERQPFLPQFARQFQELGLVGHLARLELKVEFPSVDDRDGDEGFAHKIERNVFIPGSLDGLIHLKRLKSFLDDCVMISPVIEVVIVNRRSSEVLAIAVNDAPGGSVVTT